MVFCGYVKVREYLKSRVIYLVNSIPNHIDMRAILPRHEDHCLVYRFEWYRKQHTVKYSHPNGIEIWETLVSEITDS